MHAAQPRKRVPKRRPGGAHAGALATLANYESLPSASEDLRAKCSRALKGVIAHLAHLPALDALVRRPLPEAVMKVVLQQVGTSVASLRPPPASLLPLLPLLPFWVAVHGGAKGWLDRAGWGCEDGWEH
jgi:hypothetical protein